MLCSLEIADLRGCLGRSIKESGWTERREIFALHNSAGTPYVVMQKHTDCQVVKFRPTLSMVWCLYVIAGGQFDSRAGIDRLKTTPTDAELSPAGRAGAALYRCRRRMLLKSMPFRMRPSVEESISIPAAEKFCRSGN